MANTVRAVGENGEKYIDANTDPAPDTLAMPTIDDGAIDMRELIRKLAE